jgi:hypothetical protein
MISFDELHESIYMDKPNKVDRKTLLSKIKKFNEDNTIKTTTKATSKTDKTYSKPIPVKQLLEKYNAVSGESLVLGRTSKPKEQKVPKKPLPKVPKKRLQVITPKLLPLTPRLRKMITS